jgi:hypothetical protein
MVFTQEVLFIHLGKTGGMSVSDYMRKTLKAPVFEVVSQIEIEQLKNKNNRFFIFGNRHANLTEANEIVSKAGLSPEDFKLIIVVVRNPVDIELSHYKHLHKERVIARLEKYPELDRDRLAASRQSFDDFAQTDITHFQGDLASFFTINGKVPENCRIIRFENLAVEVPGILKPFQYRIIPFPHKNKSDETFDASNLSKAALLNIRKKYKWIYDQGIYNLSENHQQTLQNTCTPNF